MKKILLLLLLVLLPGCGAFAPLATGKVDPATPSVQVEIQKVLNETNAALASVYAMAAENKRQGLWTDEQKNDAIAEADRYSLQADRAASQLVAKNFDAAKLQALATQELAKALLKRALAAKAKTSLAPDFSMMGV